MSYRYRPSHITSDISISCGGMSVMTAVWFLTGGFCSYMINKSVMWAIIHGFFGFFYVIYLCFGCGGGFSSVESGVNYFFSGERSEEVSRSEVARPTDDTDSPQQ